MRSRHCAASYQGEPNRVPISTYISRTWYGGRVHAFDVLGDPVRRRILELLADGEQTSGAVTATIQAEFGISQPAVSQHLKVLRDNGFATVRAEGARRLYAVASAPLEEVDQWLDRFRGFWNQRLDALATELARGRQKPSEHAGPSSERTRSPTARSFGRTSRRSLGTGRRRGRDMVDINARAERHLSGDRPGQDTGR